MKNKEEPKINPSSSEETVRAIVREGIENQILFISLVNHRRRNIALYTLPS